MIKFSAIALSLIVLAAVMSGVAETAPVKCRSSRKDLNRKPGSRSVSFPLIHIYSECSPFRPPNRTWESLISETITADANRPLFLNRSMSTSRSSRVEDAADTNVPVMSANGEYIIQVDFGSGKQGMYTLIDTGSNIAWIPCKQCQGCDSTAAPPFDPTMSSSYLSLPCDSQQCQQIINCTGGYSSCDLELSYGENGSDQVVGPLSSDAITLGSQYLPNFSFVCAENINGLNRNQPGLMGLGGGSLSLLKQPTAELFGATFSYCLPSLASSGSSGSGSLVLGKEAASSTSALQFTTLLKDPSKPTFYFLNLMGISVGSTKVSIPASNVANGEGTIIDSGTVITRLVAPAYTALRDAFRAQIPNMQAEAVKSFDTCYNMSSSSVNIPGITLHFDGNVDMVLQNENIVYDLEPGIKCLAFFSTSTSLSIIGNVQQQNWRVVYDLPNSKVGFAQEQCSTV